MPLTTPLPPAYKIEHIRDFLKIPPEKRELCLQEFATFLEVATASLELIKIINPAIPDEAIINDIASFTWIDDGEKNATINIIPKPCSPQNS